MNIKFFREQKGLSQKQLAELTSLSQATISEIETGKKAGSVKSLKKIAEQLDVDLSKLFSEGREGVSDDR